MSRTHPAIVNRPILHLPARLCENKAMQRLLLTLDSPAENLALDEALLDDAEERGPAAEYLRLWESPLPVVVLGRSSRVDEEVDRQACAERGIPILRRTSGGATIVAGPGCLMYAVVLSFERLEARGIHESHAYVLDRIAATLAKQIASVIRAGTSDLAFTLSERSSSAAALRKFSGNSMRAKRTHFLYHGTLLYDFDLALVSECLRSAPRQPKYRQARDHGEFIANLPIEREQLVDCLLDAWPTAGELVEWPREHVGELVATRYSQDEWNLSYGKKA